MPEAASPSDFATVDMSDGRPFDPVSLQELRHHSLELRRQRPL
jgi:hypothetical protein